MTKSGFGEDSGIEFKVFAGHLSGGHFLFQNTRRPICRQAIPQTFFTQQTIQSAGQLLRTSGWNQQPVEFMLNQFDVAGDASGHASASIVEGLLQSQRQSFVKRRLHENGGLVHQLNRVVAFAEQEDAAVELLLTGNPKNLFKGHAVSVGPRKLKGPAGVARGDAGKGFGQDGLSFAPGDVSHIQDDRFAFGGRDGRGLDLQTGVIDLRESSVSQSGWWPRSSTRRILSELQTWQRD